MKTLVLLLLFCFVFSSFSDEACLLQPENYDGSPEAIGLFEENIENKMSAIYQKEYPKISSALKMIDQLASALHSFERVVLQKHGISKNKEAFLEFLHQNWLSQADFLKNVKKLKLKYPLPFLTYRDYAETIAQVKASLNDMEEIIRPLREPYFLYTPKFKYFLRKGGLSYGHLKMEAFFRPPKDNLFQVPLLNIGFKTDRNTIVYSCLNFDAFNKNNNLF